jgi:hypothetical protein
MYDEMGIGYKDLRMVLAEPPPRERFGRFMELPATLELVP